MVASIKLFFRYIINLGFYWGIKTFFQLEFFKHKRIMIQGIPHPINLRLNSSDIKVFHEVILYKSYEFPLKNIRIIVDAGANIGLSSLYFMNKFKDALVYAIEPDKSNYELLKMNTEIYKSIIVLNTALWNKDTFLKIKDKHDNQWAFEVTECMPGDKDSFEGISIFSFMKKFNLDYIDLLKLDIEGSEKEIFTDNFEFWIERTKNIIIELHDWRKKGSSSVVFGTISKYNFNTSIINGMLLMVNQDLI